MPIAVGMYLPFGLAIPILVGGIINHLISRKRSDRDAEKRLRKGVLFSSGVIAGESLMGVGLALLASMGLQRLDLNISETVSTVITIVMALAIIIFFRMASLKKSA